MLPAIFLATALSGAPITIENCEINAGMVRCAVSNTSETAVASFAFSAIASEPERTVPWGTLANQWQPVGGGIEPGETRKLRILFSPPEQATAITVEPLAAFDLDGELIGSFDKRPDDPITTFPQELQDALSDALTKTNP